MSWKKHFRVVKPGLNQNNTGKSKNSYGASGSSSKFSSILPEIYAGHPSRIQRYYQYDEMADDSDIGAALDTIADFCTQSEEQNENPFLINYTSDVTETEVKLIKNYLTKWVRMNDFKSTLWEIIRETIKNGDQFYLRDPETNRWLWIDHYRVEMVKVDDENGDEPEEYIIRGLSLNKQKNFATSIVDPNKYKTPMGTSNAYGSQPSPNMAANVSSQFQLSGTGAPNMSDIELENKLHVVDAKHVIHLSLSVGMDANWPFGTSILQSVFKTYKQKQLLEDSVIIYRVQRAPERRIFYIDVGDMPPVRAKAHIEAIKNEIHQRRIPNRTGGGSSMLDASYNPLSMLDDYFLATTSDGRGSRIDTMPGGDNLGEIGDLSFFTKKLARGLRIPSSYLPMGDDDATASYNDGRLGAAMIQEYRFNKMCMRIQSIMAPVFDYEFKYFLHQNGIEIDNSLFDLEFNPPQNFTKYRQIELDAQQVSVYQQLEGNKKLSERFKMERFLGLTSEEIIMNQAMWKEENANKLKKTTGATPADTDPNSDLSSVGIRPSGGGFGADFNFDDNDADLGDLDDTGDMGDLDDAGGSNNEPAPAPEPTTDNNA